MDGGVRYVLVADWRLLGREEGHGRGRALAILFVHDGLLLGENDGEVTWG
jgi:hypothetical protein